MAFNPRVLVISDQAEAAAAIAAIRSDKAGAAIMAPKAVLRVVRLSGVDWRAANILKQEMLARGGDAAMPWDAQEAQSKETDVLLLGTIRQMTTLLENLRLQPYGLKQVGKELGRALAAFGRQPADVSWNGFLLPLAERTCVMGILNVTPDSFSDGGRFADTAVAIEQALRLAADGADIIDIGGESTRPGAAAITAEEEKQRVLPVIEALAGKLTIPISIDTYKADIARAALDAGAALVNDISGFSFDPAMADLVAERGVPVVLMHIKGTPRDMQKNPEYASVMGEISDYLRTQADVALAAGVAADKIIIDPGIGFGKTAEHNLKIIRRLRELTSLGYPLLLGPSRKAFIGKILGTEVDRRLEGTAATVSAAVFNGAAIVRVHDVKEMVRVVRVADAIAGRSG